MWTVKGEIGGEVITMGVDLPLHDALEFHQVLSDHVDMAYRSATIRPHMKRIAYWVEGEGSELVPALPVSPKPSLAHEVEMVTA